MSRSKFIKGAKAFIDNREHTLLREVIPGTWQLEASDTGTLVKHTQSDLLKWYLDGRFKFLGGSLFPQQVGNSACKDNAIRQFQLLPEELKNSAKMRRLYVSKILEELGPTAPVALIDESIRKIWDKVQWPKKAPPHRVTIWRWLRRYLPAGKDVRSLVNRYHRSGNFELRLPTKLVEIMQTSIDKVYMKETRGTVQDTLDDALVDVKQENLLRLKADQLPQPRLHMIKKLIARIPAFDRYSARYGRAAAERHFRSVLKSPVTSFPLERAEIDHTRLDVFVVDEETMLPLGRPWLTLCVDVHTRAILGFDLSFDPPSHMTVARCLKMALLPKGDLSTYKSVKNQWDMYGVMETLVADNGLEFHGDALEAACLSLGTNLQFCPRKQPWFKGCVERTLGTLNRGVAHGVPGTTFSNIFEKKDYDAAKHATVTLRTLREVIYLWIVDYYHQHPHKTLRDTPAHAWRAETAGMAIPLPSDAKELDAILGKIDVRCLTHKGIELNGLFYNSNEAGALARRMGTNLDVTVRYRDDNLGEIFILIPDANIYLPVRAIDYDYANGLTTWQNKVCRRFAKRQLAGRTDALALAEAKRRIRELVEADFSRKRGGTHMKSMRFKGNPPPTPAEPKQDTAPPQAPPAMSPTPVPAATPPAPVSSAPQSPFSPPAAAITKRFAAFKVDRLNPQLAAAL